LRAVAIVNPAAGSAAVSEIVSALRDTADELGIQLRIETTDREGLTAELARSLAQHADILVAVGGDGTVSDVITGSLGQNVSIGVIPAGSTNMIAKDLRIPRNPRMAARVALGEGQTFLIDVARRGWLRRRDHVSHEPSLEASRRMDSVHSGGPVGGTLSRLSRDHYS
jgi:diacylglycerol kinase family enzyme